MGHNRAKLSVETYLEPGVAMLEAMSRARRFNGWMADTLLPFVRGDVLELGAGMGNLTTLLATGHDRYLATDVDEGLLLRLSERVGHRAGLRTAKCDVTNPDDFRPLSNSMDTVICLNVLEHLENDAAALRNIYSCLKPGGRALLLVPQGMQIFGSLDEVLEHRRRYGKAELEGKMIAAGFRVERLLSFNRISYPGWWLNSCVLRRRTLSRVQLKFVDLLVPVWRRIDRFLPWPSTSLIGIGVRES